MIRVKDPVSGGLHLLGAVLAAIGAVFLIQKALLNDSYRQLITYLIFAISMILLYVASAVHHLVPKSLELAKRYRKIDHSMVFILIAGTYSPLCLVALRGLFGWILFVAIWLMAIAGVWLKLSGRRVSRRFSTSLYVGMGWVAVTAVYPLIREISLVGFLWILGGGLAYSAGAVIYARRRPDPLPNLFGFHEIFHLLVMAGSLAHYWAIFKYVG